MLICILRSVSLKNSAPQCEAIVGGQEWPQGGAPGFGPQMKEEKPSEGLQEGFPRERSQAGAPISAQLFRRPATCTIPRICTGCPFGHHRKGFNINPPPPPSTTARPPPTTIQPPPRHICTLPTVSSISKMIKKLGGIFLCRPHLTEKYMKIIENNGNH